MNHTLSIVSLFPPILVFLLGYFTHRVMLAMGAGIILAGLLANDFGILASGESIILRLWQNFEFGAALSIFDLGANALRGSNTFIFLFLLILGVFITMLQVSGGAYAYGIFARRKIKNAKGAETASLVLSMGLFIDDYLSALTVGSVMSPLTDTQRIPRIKLAYLVDSMAAPLAILCPFSSWVAAIVGFLKENGVSEQVTSHTLIQANPFTTFVYIMPFIFYSFILVAATWFIVRYQISYGLIRRCELRAMETGEVFCDERKQSKVKFDHNPQHTTLLEFFLPIGVLLFGVFGGILYSGNWWLLGGDNDFWVACQSSIATAGLFIGGGIALVICTVFFIARERIRLNMLPGILLHGITLMLPAVLVLLFAWTLGDFLRNDLHTGEYLASLLLDKINVGILPCIMFITAMLIAFSVGSAWGTAAMLFPIVIPLVLSMINAPQYATLSQLDILFPVLGAVLSGCIAGNHISPIADTTVMSSMSTQTNMRQHVYSQLQYASPGILATACAFLISGYLHVDSNWLRALIPISIGMAINFLILLSLNCKDRMLK